jgi:hypothetical protein
MYKKSILQPILLGIVTLLFAVSCDKDFNELGTDIVGDDHYGFEKNTDVTIKSYNQKLGPIASNNLPINPLGIYDNPAFGRTVANFVTQLSLATPNPTFNNTDPTEFIHPIVVDSVVLEVPYFKTLIKTETVNSQTVKSYVLDSIYGTVAGGFVTESPFSLKVYQSNYYLRNLDPSQGLSQIQSFYTDDNTLIDNNKIGSPLNDSSDADENSQFFFNKNQHKTADVDGEPAPRTDPSMRLHLNNDFFKNLILNAPDGKLDNDDVFRNYFRGLYFQVAAGAGGGGNMAMLNFKAGKVTMYYTEDKKNTTTTPPTFDPVQKAFVLNMTGNCISLLQNADNASYTTAVNDPGEASRLYLKGGEGSMSIIDLFGPTDIYKYKLRKNTAGFPIDENDALIPLDANKQPQPGHYLTYERTSSPNGVPDELEELKYAPVGAPSPYFNTKERWMINEANLIFNIDETAMSNASTIEPNRIFLYDLTHKKALVDYSYDGVVNTLYPKLSKGVFGGILANTDGKVLVQKDKDRKYGLKGSKYKIRITNYVRSLIKNDSTSVRLGLVVTENINNIGFSKLRTPNSNTNSAPTMSVMNPLGTILYGTNIPVGDQDYNKRLKLEIYYTKPN